MKKNKGFTLVELLVVIVIIGVIAGISIPLIRNISGTFEKKKYKTYADSLVSAAKLYNDSYSEDLFGHNENGCAYVTYDQLVGKDLIKDIDLNKMSCNSSSTFVRILKVGDKYSYVSFLGCGTKKNGKVDKVSYTLPVEGKTSNEMNPEYCTGVDENNLFISANPENAPAYNKKSASTKLKIQSGTGINTSVDIYAKWITKAEKDANNYDSISGLSKIGFKVKGDQQSMILNGTIISTSSGTLTTPENVSGDYYLLVKVEHLEDLYGSPWKNTTTPNSKYLVFGPFGVDNEAPKINTFKLTSSDTGYNALKAKVELNITDNLSKSNEIKVCNDLNNSCSPSSAYNSSFNYTFTGSLDGKDRTLYVAAKDLAGNISRKSATYKVGVTHTLTYDVNGGKACDPNKKTVNHNAGDNRKWGDLCTPKRDSYRFDGWFTAKTGGTKVTKDTVISDSLKVYAHWTKVEKPTCKITASSNPNGNGWYKSDVKLTLEITGKATKYGLDTSKNSTNSSKTVTVTREGSTTYYGYVENDGGSNSCNITVKLDKSMPELSYQCVCYGTASYYDSLTFFGQTLAKYDPNHGAWLEETYRKGGYSHGLVTYYRDKISDVGNVTIKYGDNDNESTYVTQTHTRKGDNPGAGAPLRAIISVCDKADNCKNFPKIVCQNKNCTTPRKWILEAGNKGNKSRTDWANLQSQKWIYIDENGNKKCNNNYKLHATNSDNSPQHYYYFDANCHMYTGWKKIGGKWYYYRLSDLDENGNTDGLREEGSKTLVMSDNKEYKFVNGVCTTCGTGDTAPTGSIKAIKIKDIK